MKLYNIHRASALYTWDRNDVAQNLIFCYFFLFKKLVEVAKDEAPNIWIALQSADTLSLSNPSAKKSIFCLMYQLTKIKWSSELETEINVAMKVAKWIDCVRLVNKIQSNLMRCAFCTVVIELSKWIFQWNGIGCSIASMFSEVWLSNSILWQMTLLEKKNRSMLVDWIQMKIEYGSLLFVL